jgi:hypothetical protein
MVSIFSSEPGPDAEAMTLDADCPEAPATATADTDAPGGAWERFTKPRPTSVHPDETSVGSNGVPTSDTPVDSAPDPGIAFRHSCWRDTRTNTRSALVAAHVAEASIERFDLCGGNAWVLQNKAQPDMFRIASNRCHCRWCEPCASEYRRKVCGNLKTWLMDTYKLNNDRELTPKLRFITLTLKSTDMSLDEVLDRLQGCFKNLRADKWWKSCCEGGISFVELTHNTRTGRWHPHLHIIAGGRYMAQKKLSDVWKTVTGDSFIVDIKQIANAAWAASYVAKYAGKSIPAAIRSNVTLLSECVIAFAGRRLFNCFGSWRGLKLSSHEELCDEWETVCSLKTLILLARTGDEKATNLLNFLRGKGGYDANNSTTPDISSG